MSSFEILGDDDLSARVHRLGAYISQVTCKGKEILKYSGDGYGLHGGMPILIPYGDLVRDAKYTFDGRVYHLPKNGVSVGNYKDSIHGIVRSQEWSVFDRGDDFISLRTFVDDPGYPSRLIVEVKYTVMNQKFDTAFKVHNVGRFNAPVVIGAHPYFVVNRPWTLRHSTDIEMFNYPDGVFPDGKTVQYSFNDRMDCSELTLDHTFVSGGTIIVKSSYSKVIIERRGMEYFEVYNGMYAGENSIAIEPLTGVINAFNNGIGLKKLSPDETMECGFSISIA